MQAHGTLLLSASTPGAQLERPLFVWELTSMD